MSGEALVIVQRLHTGNNMTVGIYMIDTFCRGLRDSLFKFRISHEEFDNYFGIESIAANWKKSHTTKPTTGFTVRLPGPKTPDLNPIHHLIWPLLSWRKTPKKYLILTCLSAKMANTSSLPRVPLTSTDIYPYWKKIWAMISTMSFKTATIPILMTSSLMMRNDKLLRLHCNSANNPAYLCPQ